MNAQKTPRGSSLEERLLLLSEVDPASGCRLWRAARNRYGYGVATVHKDGGRRSRTVHRLAYEVWVGPIPKGMTVDHLCFTPACLNPEHLRLLTHSENSRNQRSRNKTHCKRGHPFNEANTGVGARRRWCRTCCGWTGLRVEMAAA